MESEKEKYLKSLDEKLKSTKKCDLKEQVAKDLIKKKQESVSK